MRRERCQGRSLFTHSLTCDQFGGCVVWEAIAAAAGAAIAAGVNLAAAAGAIDAAAAGGSGAGTG